MRLFHRILTLVGVGFGTVLFAVVVFPALGGPSFFGGGFREILDTIWAEQMRGEALHTRDRALVRCMEGKSEVVDEILAGRLSLLEAAERFRQLQELTDDGQDPVIGPYRGTGSSDEEVCRNVIRWVSVAVRKLPKKDQAIVQQLEEQLARHLSGKKRAAH